MSDHFRVLATQFDFNTSTIGLPMQMDIDVHILEERQDSVENRHAGHTEDSVAHQDAQTFVSIS